MVYQSYDNATYGSKWLKVSWSLVFIVVGVGNLSWFPFSLVSWVVDEFGSPFALVGWVLLVWYFPLSAARSFGALGVWNLRTNPITILFIIPVLWLLGLWI